MDVFDFQDFDDHEEVSFVYDKPSGLKAIIAIHSTARGPTCGGARMYPYVNNDAAIADALRLSRGMSYKSAIADLPLGGGKAVILGDPSRDKTEARLLAFAHAVNRLGGRYITAMDMGLTPADMPVIARGTEYVTAFAQPGKNGHDSGPLTALGVFVGIRAAARCRLGAQTTKNLTVAIQGLGKVGMELAKLLHADGAKLIVADLDPERLRNAVDQFGAHTISADKIVLTECDIFSPNATGAILDHRTIPNLRSGIVAGGANNQLARKEDGEMLRDRGVLYAPDYVINGGGVICAAGQIFNWDESEVERRVLSIAETLAMIFRNAEEEGLATNVIADRLAVQRLLRR